ncbi:hypothetical protein DVH05_028362 [Phytophthora capsici]|nr:hypothetical protein DVH05_028362 [Phytophthora capsici]
MEDLDKFVVIDGKSTESEQTQAQDGPSSTKAPPVLLSGISAAVLSGYVGNFYRVVESVADVLQDEELALPDNKTSTTFERFSNLHLFFLWGSLGKTKRDSSERGRAARAFGEVISRV